MGNQQNRLDTLTSQKQGGASNPLNLASTLAADPKRSSASPPVPAIRGRPFAKGNGGRRPGSKNRSSLFSEALLDGEKEQLVRKAYELAMAGDVPMLKFLLSRILPRERTIRIDLPRLEFADDAVEALGSILRAASEGAITPSEGANLATLVNSYCQAIDMADIVKRLDTLEAKIKGLIR